MVEGLSVVDSDHGTGHFRNDDHVSQVGLDNIGFLVGRAFLLLLAKLLDEGNGLSLESTSELSSNAAREELHQLLIVHVQELVEVHSAVGELAEGTLLLELCCSLKRRVKS